MLTICDCGGQKPTPHPRVPLGLPGEPGPPRQVREGPGLPRGHSLSPRSKERLTWKAGREGGALFSSCRLHSGRLPTPCPQPAGGTTGQQREPVSPFITSRPRRQRRGGGNCSPRYVSSITPAPPRLRRRPAPASLPPPPAEGAWSPRRRGGAGAGRAAGAGGPGM
ncbi:translation initiation factor IF-2-like [Sciurus carolinensis]|uniref:translation initiation factor IF-2-like n=1 Tax=Sciurus carolinensis TaxID=30640 RepID=UPI001FB4A6C2|nr:translation initiation factor IF-2-like [Sciurus carolinensis]